MADLHRRQATSNEDRPRGPMMDNIAGGKGSVFYRAHSYHTKVPVEGIVQLIEHYTDPGDVVLDWCRVLRVLGGRGRELAEHYRLLSFTAGL